MDSNTPRNSLQQRLQTDAGDDGWAAILAGPLSRLAGVQIDADNEAATAVVQVLEALTEAPGNPTVLVDCHTNADSRKNRAGRGATKTVDVKPRGPTGLEDGPRWTAALHRPNGVGPVEFAITKSNRTTDDVVRKVLVTLERGEDGVLRAAGAPPLPAGCVEQHEESLRTAAEAKETRVLELLAELGGAVSSPEIIYQRMTGKTNGKRAAFKRGIDRGHIHDEGRAHPRRYTLTDAGRARITPTPPSRGGEGRDARAPEEGAPAGREGAREDGA